MTTGPLRVLLGEDDENDALLILGELRKGGWDPVCRRVQTKEEMLAALDSEPWDVILADYSLPHFSATAKPWTISGASAPTICTPSTRSLARSTISFIMVRSSRSARMLRMGLKRDR